MKRNISLILLIAVLFTFTFGVTTVSGTDLNNYKKQILCENDTVYFTATSNDKLHIKTYSNNTTSQYDFNLEHKIISLCASNNKIYVKCQSQLQREVQYIYVIDKSNISLFSKIIDSQSTINDDVVVDKNNYIYINKSYNKVNIYNKDGKFIRSINKTFHKILSINGNCYLFKNNEINILTCDGINKVINHQEGIADIKLSDDYICNEKGDIFKLTQTSFTKVLCADNFSPYLIGVTDKYFVICKGSTLYAYSKATYKIVAEYKLQETPFAIRGYKNQLVIIKNDYNDYTLNSDKIFDVETSNEDTVQDEEDVKEIDFDFSESVVFVPVGTTVAKFKNQFNYDNEVKFEDKTSGNIGTNDIVSIKHSGKSKNYTLIVMGDVTGEGSINSRDVYAIFDHLLGYKELKGSYKTAGDLNYDKRISNVDLVKISKLAE